MVIIHRIKEFLGIKTFDDRPKSYWDRWYVKLQVRLVFWKQKKKKCDKELYKKTKALAGSVKAGKDFKIEDIDDIYDDEHQRAYQ